MWSQAYEAVRRAARRVPGLRRMIPAAVAATLQRRLRALAVAESPDRAVMTREILPALARLRPERVLFVGCQAYTARYGRWFDAARTEYWTIDVSADSARHGSPGRHVVDSVENLAARFPAGHFDVIVLNGVIGFGLDAEDAVDRGLRACRAALRTGGVLLLGWNTDRGGDPTATEAVRAGFAVRDVLGIGAPRRVAGCTHVYDTCVAVAPDDAENMAGDARAPKDVPDGVPV